MLCDVCMCGKARFHSWFLIPTDLATSHEIPHVKVAFALGFWQTSKRWRLRGQLRHTRNKAPKDWTLPSIFHVRIRNPFGTDEWNENWMKMIRANEEVLGWRVVVSRVGLISEKMTSGFVESRYTVRSRKQVWTWKLSAWPWMAIHYQQSGRKWSHSQHLLVWQLVWTEFCTTSAAKRLIKTAPLPW